jgi:hypothetical protein
MAPRPEKELQLRAIAYRDAAEWVAHCLDLDIVATGPSREEAIEALVGAVEAQLSDAWKNGNVGHLFFPAPVEAWRKLAEILQGPHADVTRTLNDADTTAPFALHLLAA